MFSNCVDQNLTVNQSLVREKSHKNRERNRQRGRHRLFLEGTSNHCVHLKTSEKLHLVFDIISIFLIFLFLSERVSTSIEDNQCVYFKTRGKL